MILSKPQPFQFEIKATVRKPKLPLFYPATADDLKLYLESNSQLKTLADQPLNLTKCWNYYGTNLADHTRFQHFDFFKAFVFSLGFSAEEFELQCWRLYQNNLEFLIFVGTVILQNNTNLCLAASLKAIKESQIKAESDPEKLENFKGTGIFNLIDDFKKRILLQKRNEEIQKEVAQRQADYETKKAGGKKSWVTRRANAAKRGDRYEPC